MTNREYINSLPNDKFTEFVLDKIRPLKFRWTNTYIGMIQWLDEPFDYSVFGESPINTTWT